MLDYNIRDPLTPFILPEFYGWTDRAGSSSNYDLVYYLLYFILCMFQTCLVVSR
jgi:hypothetical protein